MAHSLSDLYIQQLQILISKTTLHFVQFCTIVQFQQRKNQWKDIDQPDDNFPSDIFEPYENPQRPR